MNVQVTAEGDFLDGTPPTSVTFGVMSSTATLTVSIDDDNVSEYNGAVIATISENAAYTIASGSGEARVVVQDNEKQEITFIDYTTSSSSPHEVSEGDDIAFTVKRIGNTDDALTVSLILTYRIEVRPLPGPFSPYFHFRRDAGERDYRGGSNPGLCECDLPGGGSHG